MSDRENLLRNVQIADFALVEAGLFLDTHPTDQNALSYFMAKQAQYEQAKTAYRQQVGPICVSDVNAAQGWTWGETPWPWEV